MSEPKSIKEINEELRQACIIGNYDCVSSLLSLNGAYVNNKTEYDKHSYDFYTDIINKNNEELKKDNHQYVQYKNYLLSAIKRDIEIRSVYDEYHQECEYYQYEGGNTPLILASEGGHYEIVELLLLKGAKVHHKNKDGFTALIFAIKKGYYEIFELLISHGANILNSSYEVSMPIIVASANGNIKIVESLILNGANINKDDSKGFTSLISASSNGHAEIIKILLLNGAEINKYSYNGLYNPIRSASKNGHIEAVKLLLLNGANIYDKNRDDETCLMEAFNEGRIEVVEVLQKWPLTMLIIVLQELFIYHYLDSESFIDFFEYCY